MGSIKMKGCRLVIITLVMVLVSSLPLSLSAQSDSRFIADSMLIRISEIEVFPQHLTEYLHFAREVGAKSVEIEPGVICINPMQMKRDSCQIRILEIYATPDAYREHIASDHFQKYKTGTLHMVKTLDLVDMYTLSPESMPLIFQKMNGVRDCMPEKKQ